MAALSSHLRDLIVSKSGGLEALLELPDSLKKRYREQAERCPLQFLYDALGITTQCESGYRASVNPRLHIEFALMRLSFICGKLNAPQPAAAPAVSAVPVQAPAPVAQPSAAPVQPSAPVTQPAPAPAPVAPAPSAPVAPSTPAPTPAPAAPSASEAAPEQQPRERRSRAARGGASLSMKSMMEDAPATEAVAAAEAPIPDDETLKSKWPELAKFYSDKAIRYVEWEMKSNNYTPEQLKLYCDKLYNTVMPLKPANALYIFSSFDERAILTMLELHPEAECMYITAKPLCDEVIEKVLSLGIRRVGATIHATSRDAMKKAHEANLVVNLWPGSCVEDFQLAYALGADIACSDVPVAVLDFVKNNMKWIKPMKDLK